MLISIKPHLTKPIPDFKLQTISDWYMV